MIAKNWTKWTAGTAVALLALATMPAIGQARTYTGRTPAAMASNSTVSRHAVKLTAKKKHKKHVKHKKSITKSHHSSRTSKSKA